MKNTYRASLVGALFSSLDEHSARNFYSDCSAYYYYFFDFLKKAKILLCMQIDHIGILYANAIDLNFSLIHECIIAFQLQCICKACNNLVMNLLISIHCYLIIKANNKFSSVVII